MEKLNYYRQNKYKWFNHIYQGILAIKHNDFLNSFDKKLLEELNNIEILTKY